jgi:hypothetical protein
MKHPRKRTANRGYQLTAEAAAYLSENRPVSYQFTPEGEKRLLQEKSHRQMVDETIDQHEAENLDYL